MREVGAWLGRDCDYFPPAVSRVAEEMVFRPGLVSVLTGGSQLLTTFKHMLKQMMLPAALWAAALPYANFYSIRNADGSVTYLTCDLGGQAAGGDLPRVP